MAFSITEAMRLASENKDLKPQLVLEIDGVSTIYSTTAIQKVAKIGDEDLVIGSFVIGGLAEIKDQSKLISFTAGTSTSIKQTLQLDKGKGESIPTLTIGLVDKNLEISNLVSPGKVVTDMLGRSVKLRLGFQGTAFPTDFIVIFRANVLDIDSGPGNVKLLLGSPENKKISEIFNKGDTELDPLNSGTFAPGDVNTSTEAITDTAHGMANGQPISFTTTDTLPAGLSSGFVVEVTTNTFKVSDTIGGAAQDLTDGGVGTHSYQAGLSSSSTTVIVDSTTSFLSPFTGPDGTIDSTLKLHIRINDEVIRYEATTATTFGTLTRGALGTTPSTHSPSNAVESFYRLEGNVIDLALKVMCSGVNGPYSEDNAMKHFVRISPSETVANTIFFNGQDISKEEGIVVGDFITTTGDPNGAANNVTNKAITAITQTDLGSFITVSGVNFVESTNTVGLIDFTSQFDTLGEGLRFLGGNEVDIEEHLFIQRTFLSSFDYDFFLKDSIKGNEFLSEQLYNPASAFSIPRKAKASLGFNVGPLPTQDVKIIDDSNVINPSKLRLRRSTTKNFFNVVVYKFEQQVLEDRLKSGQLTISGDSITRIKIGNKPLIIEAQGMRVALSGKNLAIQATSRRLNRFKFGAEWIRGVQLNFATGFNLEIGDKVLVDLADLQLTDINTGTRAGEERIFEVSQKSLGLKDGQIIVDLIDTNFNKDARFGLISPASFVDVGIDSSNFTIRESFNSLFGTNEFKKWNKYPGVSVQVRNSDFSTVDKAVVDRFIGNQVVLKTPLSFTPSSGMIMEMSAYSDQPTNVNSIFAFMSDVAFPDGKVTYKMF